jgi:hypothetical protein
MPHLLRARARRSARSAMLLGALACWAGIVHAQSAGAPALPLYEGMPIAGAQVVFGDADVQRTLPGASAAELAAEPAADAASAPIGMGADPKQPNAVVEARYRIWADAMAPTLDAMLR